MKRFLVVLILVLPLSIIETLADNSSGEILRSEVYHKGMAGYSSFRIPAIIRTKSDVLLAFAEARKDGGGDSGNIDLVVRRSEDGGRTWSDIITVWDDGANTCGNPAPVVDYNSGRVLLLMTWNNGKDSEHAIMHRQSLDSRRVFICYSDDEGKSWSAPKDITSSTKLDNWAWYATGPCHAIQLLSKQYRGRIVVPCNHSVYDDGGSAYNSHLLLSDDGGESWRIGGVMLGGNESTVAESADGSIVHNARWQSGDDRFARHYAISNDGGQISGRVVRDANLIEPVCQGSMISYAYGRKLSNKMLFSNPASTKRRESLTLRYSRDGGRSWSGGVVIEPGKAAYSDLVVLRGKNIGVLFETGTKNTYERIVFAVISRKAIK
ncbi:MAG: exo-alpha-sialidase [Alistipes sp.]|nr:exo-alpha-sialidase [Alistipes sp.]